MEPVRHGAPRLRGQRSPSVYVLTGDGRVLVETKDEHGVSPPLLLTKLHAPPRRAQWVSRDGLVERLRVQPGTKLTVLAAPAGSGKTTLLGIWCEAEAGERPVAWLSLDDGDNDPVVLWEYVLAALRKACPELHIASSPGQLGRALIVEHFLPELINALASLGDVTLILDDFHQLSAGPARDSMAWFIDHAPPTFRLVLATRREPALPLAALRAHGELIELRAQDLGFTRAEAELLLNERLDLGLEPELVSELVDRTEGWPAGIYLAALSLRGADDRPTLINRFGPETRHVVDFLVSEALDAHDPVTQNLMLQCSVLERLSGPICDAVLEQEGSDEVLADLARANLFLRPLDDRGEWYRFHHLFAQLLRFELERRHPGMAAGLHRRAFDWHRANGLVDQAIDHALAAESFADAAELIAVSWVPYVELQRFATVHAWLAQLPLALRRHDPSLLLVDAWVCTMEGKREQAEGAIAAVEQSGPLDLGPLPDGFSSVEASLTTLRGLIAWGDTREGLRYARRAAQLEGPESPWRAVVSSAMGIGLYFSGEFVEADRWLTESAELARAGERWVTASTALSIGSFVAGELGMIDRQASLAEQAFLITRDRFEALSGEAYVALGASLAARGQLDEALPMTERGVELLRPRGHLRAIAEGLIRQAGVLRALSRPEATEVIAEARMVIDACPDPGILENRLALLEQPPRPRSRSRNGLEELSDREVTILRLLRGTLSERDIGRELYLSHNTIHSHAKSIYRKLGVSSRSEALKHAKEIGLI